MKPSFKHFHYMLASSTTYCYLHNTIFSSFSWEQWNRTTVSGITCELTTTLIPLLVLATRCTLNSIMSNHSSSLRYELTYYHTSNCSGSLDGYFVSPSRHGQFCKTLLGVQDLNLRTLDYASSKIDHFSNSHRLLHYLGYNSLYQLSSDSQSESETSRTSLLLLYENQTPQYYPSIVTSKLYTPLKATASHSVALLEIEFMSYGCIIIVEKCWI